MVASSAWSTLARGTELSTFFVGGYTPDMDGESTGIAVLESAPDGSLHYVGVVAEVASPSYLARHGDLLYAAIEGEARVQVYRRGPGTTLEALGSASSGGDFPCHLLALGDVTLVSNYGSGTIGVLATGADGSIELTQVIAGEGSGPHEAQDGPHAHSTFALDSRTILSADLGADRVHVHTLVSGRLERTATLAVPAGTGPRDFRRHPSGRILLLGELSGQVLVLDWIDGELSIEQAIAVPGVQLGDHAAEISVSDDASLAIVGLRGSNRVGLIAISPDGLFLDPAGSVETGGNWPRHHVVDGKFLYVANQLSSTVSAFEILGDGGLSSLGEPVTVPSPTHLLRA